MQPTEEFTGLGMPVFTAFGWAGEEAALNYALSQLEQFAALLHTDLPLEIREDLPHYGLNREVKSAYLAAEADVENDVHITFNARPVSLETQLAVTDKAALSRALKQIDKNPKAFYRLLQNLEPGWILRVQQVLVDDETGEQGHHQDLYRGPVADLDEEKFVELYEKIDYLGRQDKWATPIYVSLLVSADQAAAMKQAVVHVMSDRISLLAPVIATLRGRAPKSPVTPEPVSIGEQKPRSEPVIPADLLEQAAKPLTEETFIFLGELKPLHLKKGFINMTPEHWPFFALNARTESRPVTVIAGDIRDDESAVWRLQPDNLARLVLGSKAHRWLEDNFTAGDYVQVTATRIDETEIEIVLDTIT